MKFFRSDRRRSVIIVGCGLLGAALAGALDGQGDGVTVIDRDREAFRNLPDKCQAFTEEGDGTDLEVLKAAGIETSDVVIAATGDDNSNIMTAQIARHRFAVGTVLARIDDASKGAVVRDDGIGAVSSPLLLCRELCSSLVKNEESA